MSTNIPQFLLRRARHDDIPIIAQIHRLAFRTAMPRMPELHTPEEDLWFFSEIVFPQQEIWVTEKITEETTEVGEVTGFISFHDDWIAHLYIHPASQGQGQGTALLQKATLSVNFRQLWAFQCNIPARKFYEKHGFRVERETDGANNEEKQPDVLYAWRR
jgi:putative acetyltransferase